MSEPLLSDEELAALAGGVPPASPAEEDPFPTPAPEVVSAAKAILSEGVDSRLEEDGKVIFGKPLELDIPEAAKVAFVRHIMYGAAFDWSYKLFNGLTITFTSLSAAQDRKVLRQVRAEVGKDPLATKENEPERYRIAKALASVCQLVDPPDVIFVEPDYPKNLESIQDGQLALILDYYDRFSALYQSLLDKVDDESFWQTL